MTSNDRGQDTKPRKWPWVVAGIAALALAGGLFWSMTRGEKSAAPKDPLPPLITSVEVSPADSLTLEQTGFVRSRASINVAAQVGGQIEKLGDNFSVGEHVSAGDLLFALDTTSFQADVEQAKANVEQARAAVAQARIARDRRQELENRDFASEARLQEAILQVARSEAELASAQAQLTRARDALDDAKVTAPFDAVVTAESAAPGQLIQPGVTVGTLVGADSVEIEMGLLPSDVEILGQAERAIGARVDVLSSDTGTAITHGVVVAVVPRIESATRTVTLVVAVRDPFSSEAGRPLRVDELVQLRLPVAASEKGALTIPAEAVKGRRTVWRITENRLERVGVDILRRSENEVTLNASVLEAGDMVMLSDPASAFDGKKVRTSRSQDAASQNRVEGE